MEKNSAPANHFDQSYWDTKSKIVLKKVFSQVCDNDFKTEIEVLTAIISLSDSNNSN